VNPREGMKPVDEEFRYERKFQIDGLSAAEVAAAVHWNPALFFEEFAPRAINNIYLDSPDLYHYRANVDGHGKRIKIRIRWYGPGTGPVERPVLEIKRRHGLRGTKESAPLRPFAVDQHLSAQDVRTILLSSNVPDTMRRELDHVEPTLINHYWRRYFRSADRQVRVTLDWDLGFCRIRRHRNSFADRVSTSQLVVMEIKYADCASSCVIDLARSFPFRLTRMSKYVFGMHLLHAR
jgi:hypothetical protein